MVDYVHFIGHFRAVYELGFHTLQDNPNDFIHVLQMTIKIILIGKIDLDDAYQNVNENAQIASTCIAIVGKLSFPYLSLPFGTTYAP